MARILIVEDEKGIREFLADTLASDGHDTVEAGMASEGLAMLRDKAFDLVITDLRMPGGLDGMDLLRAAKADQPDMEVIVLTAHGTVESAVEAMRLGAFDYLQKPVASPAEVRLLVARAIEHRRLVALKDASERGAARLPPLTYGDPVMVPVVRSIAKVAPTNATVLLLGESGTGKEVAARTVHAQSRRASGPFIAVNCAAISESLMESEIFGHEKGAFTGATAARRGRLELADGGTLFLDEIGELKVELQAKLLRVLQERTFERVGGSRTVTVDVRWIAATNRDLEGMVRDGTFREDLYHRLAVFPVRLPPLRDRRADVVPIAEALLVRIGADLGRASLKLDTEAATRLREAEWPGNVRDLANTLERAAILSEGDVIRGADLQMSRRAEAREAVGRTMSEIERDAIRRALGEAGGNRRIAAERLGIGVRTLYEKLKRYDIE